MLPPSVISGAAARDHKKRALVVRLWAEGLSLTDIARRVGWANANVAGVRITTWRAEGLAFVRSGPGDQGTAPRPTGCFAGLREAAE